MDAMNAGTSRRAFFVTGAAAIGAGMATTVGTVALASPETGPPDAAVEREAIRRLHAAFVAGVENQTHEAAVATHHAYRSNALQQQDRLAVSADGTRATAAWHVDVKVGGPVEGDSTLAQMARLQGQLADVHWETGRLDAEYVKVHGQWRIVALKFQSL